MNTTEATLEVKSISSRKMLSMISQLLAGGSSNPDPDNPMPHGPWDPYIRRALQRMGPSPEPWKAINRYSFTELNPQPLPPKTLLIAALTQEIIDHSLLSYEIAETINQGAEERSIIIVSGKVDQYLNDFDELCYRLSRYINFPRPPKGTGDDDIHPNWDKYTSALDYLIAAAVFQQNALTVGTKIFSRILHGAEVKLTEGAINKL